jgi:hypothetical protein
MLREPSKHEVQPEAIDAAVASLSALLQASAAPDRRTASKDVFF